MAAPLGHRWRWELTEASPGDTTITGHRDLRLPHREVPLMITAFGYDKKNGDGIASTLERLAERFGG